ncbi:MAG: Ig-like domain-containing protein [Bryobacteraceae bacterium]
MSTAAAGNISIKLEAGAFRVIGLTEAAKPAEGWASVVAIYAGNSDVPMLGSYAFENRALAFHPRFPLAAGVRYRAVFKGIETVEVAFDGPPIPTNPLTRVDSIYPSADILPSNALRFYIYFSAPMSRGEAWRHIHLIDAATNQPVDMPFLELDQELWDQNNQRLTVLFDPGRIKRGLVPTNTIGPAIVEGKHYKLVVDRDFHDARGVSLLAGFEKSFRGGPSNRIPPEPKNWRITAPHAGTTQPLVITFPKPMDYVLLQRMIGIFDAQREIQGRISVAANETEWRFTPAEPWKPGSYRITADNVLEDISGNHLDRPFDVDMFETVTKHIVTNTTSIPFEIR